MIANELIRDKAHPVGVLFVTFSEYSMTPIVPDDRHDMQQALLQRIAFAASAKSELSDGDLHDKRAYHSFRQKNYYIDQSLIETWLDDHRVILLVDDLDSLEVDTNIAQAYMLGEFIQNNFLSTEGRHRRAPGDHRRIHVKSLPLVDNYYDILSHLDPHIDGDHEVVCHGFLPGMILGGPAKMAIALKHQNAVKVFNERTIAQREAGVSSILHSVVTGSTEQLPTELQIFLATGRINGQLAKTYSTQNSKTSWVPSMLQFVLEHTHLLEGHWLNDAKKSVVELCNCLQIYGGGPGKTFEYLFGLTYLARSIARLPYDEWLPKNWTLDPSVEVAFNPFDPIVANMHFCSCISWDGLKQGININSGRPTIAVFLPNATSFQTYDVITAYFERNRMVDCLAFQLKEGRDDPKTFKVTDEIRLRFLVKGVPPKSTIVSKQGWVVPTAEERDGFFNESWQQWKPSNYKLSKSSFRQKQK
ncbi:hypothetical protein MPSEU_000260100 [Mayamaea pseudoterrestris]|nr:hypothetical protein MPSEU_000260100 [Mayamaea pseudoterrestris]